MSSPESKEPPIKLVKVDDSIAYSVGHELGSGGYASVYLGKLIPTTNAKDSGNGTSAEKVALKIEHRSRKRSKDDPNEWKVYNSLGSIHGVPRVHYKGHEGDYPVMIMDLLGDNLSKVREKNPDIMSTKTVSDIAVKAICILKEVHSKGYVHVDIKPENFLRCCDETSEVKKLFLVDFGLATVWKEDSKTDQADQHVAYYQQPDVFRGTVWYASVHAHLGRRSSRRDDLISLAYTLVFLCTGTLPWKDCKGDDTGLCVAKKKMDTLSEELCCPEPFGRFVDYVVNLKFDEVPNYALYIDLFNGTGSTQTNGAQQLIREPKVDVKMRWISIYNAQRPMKQSCESNIKDGELAHYIDKGKKDRLFIRSVTSSENLWALVMDSGTGFTAQVYNLSRLLPNDEWIMEQWEKNYHISSIAGRDDGMFLVVMSKGTKYAEQLYKVSDSFPFKWINRRWGEARQDFQVTSMGTAGSKWVVVMSRNAGFTGQVVELDFLFPSEGICLRRDAGYHIIAIAATKDQVASVLSVPVRKPIYLTQETLRTSYFPCQNVVDVVDKWKKNLYIASVCYGRTVS